MAAKTLAIFASLAAVNAEMGTLEANCGPLFEDFKVKFGKNYKTEEEHITRKSVFCTQMKKADGLNKINPGVFGITKFSDQTEEEFSVLLGRKNKATEPKHTNVRMPKKVKTPAYVNWAEETGIVTPVKNQGQCGTCWAFSAAETIESAWAMAGNSPWEFSIQQIASCVTTCYGCGGGDTPDAYDYIMNSTATVGLSSAWSMPYVQSMTKSCSGTRCTESCSDLDVADIAADVFYAGPYAQISSYEYATPPCTGQCKSQDLQTLMDNVAISGPASVCVNAANWNAYTGGIMSSAACGGYAYRNLDHCVQLTGFNNEDPSAPYFIVRNSWATNWGEDGYIYLDASDNTCGVADEATFVTISNSQVGAVPRVLKALEGQL
jgi:C1A family cysteine protease